MKYCTCMQMYEENNPIGAPATNVRLGDLEYIFLWHENRSWRLVPVSEGEHNAVMTYGRMEWYYKTTDIQRQEMLKRLALEFGVEE